MLTRVSLIDVDSKIPNVALMKLSTYHKERGDEVKLGYDWKNDTPDVAYASKMFDFTREPYRMPSCETFRGGPGYDFDAVLPCDDKTMPDYSLYGCDYAIGRFSRGCPNRCPWCVVPKMDGNDVRHVADLADFWCGQERVRIIDDNLLADKELFIDACRQLHDAHVKVTWEALDIRLIDDDTARALKSVRMDKSIHFAWDSHAQDGFVEDGLEILRRNGMKPWRFMFYVLIGYNTTPEYDMHRIMTLRELGANPFVMPFDRKEQYQRDLARWCNNKIIFKSCTFEEYLEQKYEKER